MEKSKSLVVRTNSVGTAPDNRRKAERGPELAEQLNEEIKQKYVKGRWIYDRAFPPAPPADSPQIKNSEKALTPSYILAI